MKAEELVVAGFLAYAVLKNLGGSPIPGRTAAANPLSLPTISALHENFYPVKPVVIPIIPGASVDALTSTITFAENPAYPFASGKTVPVEFYTEPTSWGSYEYMVIP